MKQKSKATADLKKNRLHVTLIGHLTVKDLQEVYTDIRFCVADLQPGFDAIADFTQCKVAHLAGVGIFIRISEHLQKNGINQVIRIGRKSQLVFHQISKIVARNSNYKITYVNTQEEAEALLAENSEQPMAEAN